MTFSIVGLGAPFTCRRSSVSCRFMFRSTTPAMSVWPGFGATMPNARGFLAGWILDPQSIKPGNHMPANALAPDDLQALLDYLATLQ